MNNKLIASIVVIIVVVGSIVWYVNRHKSSTQTQTQPVLSISAFNETKNLDATATPASAKDMIAYTLTAQNPTSSAIRGYVMSIDIGSISDSASLVDTGGASYNAATHSLDWTPLDIDANSSLQKKFVVQVNSGTSLTSSVLDLKFNNDLRIALNNPVIAGATTPSNSSSSNSYVAPTTGASGYLTLLLAMLMTIAVFAIRSVRTGRKT